MLPRVCALAYGVKEGVHSIGAWFEYFIGRKQPPLLIKALTKVHQPVIFTHISRYVLLRYPSCVPFVKNPFGQFYHCQIDDHHPGQE